jgi:hypothetical protein
MEFHEFIFLCLLLLVLNGFFGGDYVMASERRKAIFYTLLFMLFCQFILVDSVSVASGLIESLGKDLFLVGD